MSLKNLFTLDIANPFMRLFVPIGFIQGWIVYFIYRPLDTSNIDPVFSLFETRGYLGHATSSLVAAGLMFFLSYRQGAEKRAALAACAFGLLHLGLWLLASPAHLERENFFWIVPWYFCAAILTYAALPFVQSYVATGNWRFSYPALFQHAWNNAQIIGSSYLLTGLFFLVCLLAAGLLDILKIHIFLDILRKSWFFVPAYFTVKAVGYAIARENESIVLALRRLCLGFCSFLAPILAVFSAIFVLALPFTGLETVWHTRIATPIFLSFAITTIFFFNAIFQDGARESCFERLNGKLQQLALIILPLFGVLACYSTDLRVGQYGLTPERYYALLLGVIMIGYGCCYAVAALRPVRAVRIIQHGNIVMALVLIALAILINFPYVNAAAMSARDRYQMIAENRLEPKAYDLWWLKHELGDAGADAFARLKTITDHPRQKELTAALLKAEAQKYRYDNPVNTPDDTLRSIGDYITMKPAGTAPPPELVDFLLKHEARSLEACLSSANAISKCTLIAADLNRDGRNEYVWVVNWEAKLLGQDLVTQAWRLLPYQGNAVVNNKPGHYQGWAEVTNKAENFTTQPPKLDDLLIGDRVIMTFRPTEYPAVAPPEEKHP